MSVGSSKEGLRCIELERHRDKAGMTAIDPASVAWVPDEGCRDLTY